MSPPSRDDLRAIVLRSLKRIAPDGDFEHLRGEDDFRDALDIDSMDMNGFVLALHDAFHVDIAEQDYPRFATLDGCVRELERRLSPGP